MNDGPEVTSPNVFLPNDIFLVCGSLRTGGIETLIVRMANYFAATGARVSVCCNPGGALESMLDHAINMIAYRETSDLVTAVLADQRGKQPRLQGLIISFDPISASRALMIEAALSKNINVLHITGVFHPRAYFMTGERKDRIFLNYLVARAVGKQCLFFMNQETRESHEIRWNTDLSRSAVVALPINQIEAKWHPSRKAELRVVSVGRLVDFKAYNLGAASVVRSCRKLGLTVTWDIFGDGPMLPSIDAAIKANGVIDQVRLRGELHYSRFSEIISDYDLFVGMGTAALEAAMAGVPTICATVDEETCCYGYLGGLPFGNVGEPLISPPTLELKDLFLEYSMLAQEERALLSQQSRTAAEKYGMPKFYESLSGWINGSIEKPPWLVKFIIGGVYRLMTESYVVKTARRFAARKTHAS